MIRAGDNRAIDPSNLASEVGPDIVLEMSIILEGDGKTSKELCPRCQHENRATGGGLMQQW